VRAIRPGLPLFLYNYSTHQLHGIFEVTPSNSICFLVDPSGSPTNFIVTWYVLFINQAASFGGTNIDPTAWEDKKCPGESRFPAQVSFFPHFSDGQSLARVSLAIWAMADDRRSAQHQTDKTKARDPSTCFDVHKGPGPTTGMPKKIW